MSENRKKLVRDHLEAFSTKDWERYRETVVPNVLYVERATGRRAEGVEEMLNTLQAWTKAFPDLRGTIRNLMFQDEMVMAEIRWEGTHQGTLQSAFGEIPPTGNKGTVDAIELFQFEGDKIAEARHYFDFMTILQQLGVEMPAAASVTST